MTLRTILRTEPVWPDDPRVETDWDGGDTATIGGELYITNWRADYWLGPFSEADATRILELIAEATAPDMYGEC